MAETMYGYVRVSTREQNEDRQMLAMERFGVEHRTFFWTSSPDRILTARVIGGCCGACAKEMCW